MNKLQELEQQYAALGKEIERLKQQEQSKPTKEERFWQLFTAINRIEIDKEKHPYSTFGYKDDKLFFEYNSKSGYLYLRYTSLWEVFYIEYSMNDEQIRKFIKGILEEHFNCERIVPELFKQSLVFLIEGHFNCRENTPLYAEIINDSRRAFQQ